MSIYRKTAEEARIKRCQYIGLDTTLSFFPLRVSYLVSAAGKNPGERGKK